MPTNLNNLKSKVYKLDVDKLVPVSVDLNKLSDEKMLLKKMYIKTTTVNAKINEVKNEIPNITSLATTTVLTSVENKTSNVSNLVKKNCLSNKYQSN